MADAVIASDRGLDGIVLSNHGGRQLDGAPAIIDLVQPAAAEAVGGDLDIVCDGGVRRGGDIVKALALGATSCMIGRPYLYGLAAAGEEGVDWVIEHLHTSMKRRHGPVRRGERVRTDPGPELPGRLRAVSRSRNRRHILEP